MGKPILFALEGVALEMCALLFLVTMRNRNKLLSFALKVAFICSGANYAQYETVLGSMGMHQVRDYKFYETIELLESHTTKLLDKCELAKEKMNDIPSDQIGSWDRAVTVADGA